MSVDPEEDLVRPCPNCPDGNVWDSNGPTCKVCPVCNGFAALKADGSALPPRKRHYSESLFRTLECENDDHYW